MPKSFGNSSSVARQNKTIAPCNCCCYKLSRIRDVAVGTFLDVVYKHVARLVYTTQQEGTEVGERDVLYPPGEPLQKGSLRRLTVDHSHDAATLSCQSQINNTSELALLKYYILWSKYINLSHYVTPLF